MKFLTYLIVGVWLVLIWGSALIMAGAGFLTIAN